MNDKEKSIFKQIDINIILRSLGTSSMGKQGLKMSLI
jgi:hypothetical protein